MKFCPNCGSEVKENAKFCPKCGYNLAALHTSEDQENSEPTMTNKVRAQFSRLQSDDEAELIVEESRGLGVVRSELKIKAQKVLSGRFGEWTKSILMLLIAQWVIYSFLIYAVLRFFTNFFSHLFSSLANELTYGLSSGLGMYNSYGNYGGYSSYTPYATGFSNFIWFILFLIALVLYLVIVCLRDGIFQWSAILTLRGQKADGQKLLSYFIQSSKNRVLKANFLMKVFLFLWNLLFVIPGVIKQASYAMTNFLLEKNKNLSATDAITLSRQIMYGHRTEFLILRYSFYFWNLGKVFFIMPTIFIAPWLGIASASFLDFYLIPYQNVTEMQFLEIVYNDYVEQHKND